MLFSSIPFLFAFLPIVLIVYFAVPKLLKNAVILFSSLFFYWWGEPKYALLMVVSIILGYVFGLLIEKFRKCSLLLVALSAITSLSLLGYFKYADFFIENFNAVSGMSVPLLKIALPIGISFYTFQILSYTVDVYRGDVPAQKNIINFGAYVTMFSQLIAGPIVRYSDINEQLENRTHSFERTAKGGRRFVLGLAKKILIANQMYELIETFKASDDKSVLFFWIYGIAYMIHIYFDFSGYSDMAIGLGTMFGFDFIENFNYPYISTSATEFWRRWHMSLGSWFRDYVYIPMGGNRVPKLRQYFNILTVWFLTGMWHGAAWNFIVWGLMFAVILTIEKQWLIKLLNKMKPLAHIYLIVIIMISFIIFDARNMSEGFHNIGALFGAGDYPLISAETVYYLKSFALLLIIGAVGSTPIVKKATLKLAEGKYTGKVINIIEPVVLAGLLILMTAYLVDGSFNPFLYFRF